MVDSTIKTSGAGVSLAGLIGTRRVEGDVPPIITVGRIPMSVINSIRDMHIIVEDVPSDDGFDDFMADTIAEMFVAAVAEG